MAAPRTLFEVFGVSPEATQPEIDRAWHIHFKNAGASHDRIPAEVRQAYDTLKVPDKRARYRVLLHAALSGRPVLVRPEEHAALTTFCQEVGLTIEWDGIGRNTYRIRLPAPEPARPEDLGPPPRFYQPRKQRLVWRAVRYLLLGGVFRNTTLLQKLFIACAYVLAFSLLSHLYARTVEYFRELDRQRREYFLLDREERRATEHRTLSQQISTRLDTVRPLLQSWQSGYSAFNDAFRQVLGVSAEEIRQKRAAPSRELDRAILGHPTVRDAWDTLMATLVPQSESERTSADVSAIAQRHQANQPRPEDPARLDEISDWLNRSQQLLTHQRTSLEHIRVTLQADRFEQLNEPLKKE